MAELRRFEQLVDLLRTKAARAKKDSDAWVIVGYTAAYAAAIHEMGVPKHRGEKRRPPGRGRVWDPQGRAQPKFLSYPAHFRAGEITRIVREALQAGRTMAQSLLLGGLFLQRESQKLVPVDTGNLKNSAFTRLER